MTTQELLEQYLLSRSLYWRHELSLLDAEVVGNIKRLFNAIKLDISDAFTAEAQGLLSITEWNQDRLEQLNLWLDDVISGTKIQATLMISEASLLAGSTSTAMYNNMLSFGGLAAGVRTVGFTPEQLQTWFDDSVLGKSSLAGWIDTAFDQGVKQSIFDVIRKGGLEGKGIAPIAKNVLQTAIDEGIAITLRQAQTLTRSYIQNANTGAMATVYDANVELIDGYEWVAILDNHTCIRCAGLDGTIYKKRSDMPPQELHPNCRCITLPKIKSWRELGIDIDDLEEVARPWVLREKGALDSGSGAKIINHGTATGNFDGWWKTLSEKDKAVTVGNVRTKLLNNGQIKWTDLVDNKTGNRKTLKELGFDEQGNAMGKGGRSIVSRVSPSVKKSTPKPQVYWDKKTDIGQWHEVAFKKSPDYIKRVVGKSNTTSVRYVGETVAYYSPFVGIITMGGKYKNKDYARSPRTWAHEFGHSVDFAHKVDGKQFSLGNKKFTNAINDDIVDFKVHNQRLFDKNKDAFTGDPNFLNVKAKSLGFNLREIDNAIEKYTAIPVGEKQERLLSILSAIENKSPQSLLDALTGKKGNVANRNELSECYAKSLVSSFSDIIGSMTTNMAGGLNKTGLGHTTAYYKRAGAREAEVFAGLFLTHAENNSFFIKMLEKFAPNTNKEFMEGLYGFLR